MLESRRVVINTASNWIGMGVQMAVNMFLLAYVFSFGFWTAVITTALMVRESVAVPMVSARLGAAGVTTQKAAARGRTRSGPFSDGSEAGRNRER